ncbi:MAG: glycosyltransferase [Muribaculum sp.]|nr:glycosyltransferase [Muribaculum sp.]
MAEIPVKLPPMKILFVTLHYLFGNGGGVFASRAYANAFAALLSDSDSMRLICPGKNNQPPEGLSEKIDVIEVPDTRSSISKALHFVCGETCKTYAKALTEVKSGHYDIVVFDNSHASFRLIDIAHKKGTKVITIHHNFEQEYVRDNQKHWLVKQISLFWTKKAEHQSLLKSDISLTLTSEDRDLLLSAYSTPGIRPNIKVLGTFEYKHNELPHPSTAHRTAIKHFVITGSLGSIQTRRSLMHWLQTYYPLLKQVFPHSRLTIAGKNPSAGLVEACENAGINIIANPTSMHLILSEADYYICPTSLGGGLKLRIMDGLKYGIPVITHEVSARGYNDFVTKGTVLPYRDPASFLEACGILQSSLWKADQIQSQYKEIFSFESGAARLKQILTKDPTTWP